MTPLNLLFLVASYVASGTSTEGECHLPLDIMFVQDTTGSFDDDLPHVVAQIPSMVDSVNKRHPYSKFGVVEFKDKPFEPLGYEGDYCYKLKSGLTDDVSEFQQGYKDLFASGGWDGPEASYHAVLAVAEDEAVGWRPLSTDHSREATPGMAGARVVVLSTDALPHLPDDYIKMYSHEEYAMLPDYLAPYSGSIYPLKNNNTDWQCTEQDYPSAQQVVETLRKNDVYLVILTPDISDVSAAWKWVNEDLFQQHADFYQFIEADSSNLLGGVLDALEAVTATACATTTAPLTTLPTRPQAVVEGTSNAVVTPSAEAESTVIEIMTETTSVPTTRITTAKPTTTTMTTTEEPTTITTTTAETTMTTTEEPTTITTTTAETTTTTTEEPTTIMTTTTTTTEEPTTTTKATTTKEPTTTTEEPTTTVEEPTIIITTQETSTTLPTTASASASGTETSLQTNVVLPDTPAATGMITPEVFTSDAHQAETPAGSPPDIAATPDTPPEFSTANCSEFPGRCCPAVHIQLKEKPSSFRLDFSN